MKKLVLGFGLLMLASAAIELSAERVNVDILIRNSNGDGHSRQILIDLDLSKPIKVSDIKKILAQKFNVLEQDISVNGFYKDEMYNLESDHVVNDQIARDDYYQLNLQYLIQIKESPTLPKKMYDLGFKYE